MLKKLRKNFGKLKSFAAAITAIASRFWTMLFAVAVLVFACQQPIEMDDDGYGNYGKDDIDDDFLQVHILLFLSQCPVC